MKPDEVLEVSLKLPFAPNESSKALDDKAKAGNKQSAAGRVQGTGGALIGKQRPGLGGLGTLLPRPRFTSPAAPLLAPQNPALSDTNSGSTAKDGGHFILRCGSLLISAEVKSSPTSLQCVCNHSLSTPQHTPCRIVSASTDVPCWTSSAATEYVDWCVRTRAAKGGSTTCR